MTIQLYNLYSNEHPQPVYMMTAPLAVIAQHLDLRREAVQRIEQTAVGIDCCALFIKGKHYSVQRARDGFTI